MYLIDSYQNQVYAGGDENESIESITSNDRGDSMEHSGESNRSDAAENHDSVSRVESGRRERRNSSGHGSADRNEAERGRAASGDSFEDEADNALFRRQK